MNSVKTWLHQVHVWVHCVKFCTRIMGRHCVISSPQWRELSKILPMILCKTICSRIRDCKWMWLKTEGRKTKLFWEHLLSKFAAGHFFGVFMSSYMSVYPSVSNQQSSVYFVKAAEITIFHCFVLILEQLINFVEDFFFLDLLLLFTAK